MSTPAPDLPPATGGLELTALRAYSGEPNALARVGFWPRVAARLIDLVVHLVVSFCAGIFFSILLVIAAAGHPPAGTLLRLQEKTASGFVLALLGLIVYHLICEGMHGSTLGKRALSMVVLQEDGSPCRMWPATIRSFAYLLDSLFFGFVAYFAMQRSPQEQRYGDEWAHTVVCRRSDAPPGSLRSGGRFVAAFLLGIMADAALAMTALLLKLSA